MQEALLKKIHKIGIVTLILTALVFAQGNNPNDSNWVKLFNETDINDWDFKIRGQALNTDPNNTFKYETGMLRVDYSDYTNFNGNPFGHAANKLYELSHYILRIEYRFTGTQVSGGPGWANENNGIMFHSQSMASMGQDQDFPTSMEAQLLGPNGYTNGFTMNLCTPGTQFHNMNGGLVTTHCTNTNTQNISAIEWVKAGLLVLGDSLVKHIVEGDTVMTYQGLEKDNGDPLAYGYIAIQAESAPTDFRQIEVLNLEGCMDNSATNYKSYYVQDSSAACEYPDPVQAEKGLISEKVKWDGSQSVLISMDGFHSIKVLDLNGKVLFQEKAEGYHNYNLKTLILPGIYTLQLQQGENQFSKKIIKLR